ncbi:MAG TPA: hypothetical protein VFY40_24665, partial [Blastocatellia bacterium]|nr:hypothetical protein [Blastocatellia bacterium]
MAEATESYREAMDLYNQYLAANPSDPKASEIKAQVDKLRKFFGLYTAGVLETNMGDHKAAAHNYEDALKVLPDSKMAQDALKKAQSQK